MRERMRAGASAGTHVPVTSPGAGDAGRPLPPYVCSAPLVRRKTNRTRLET